ncbi:kinase-like protein [Exidia glandulosa HHB12029]|uniref:Kinase-like protein n=1 Tax=Exidia glandulosa HHB12029 TaxID=1314781 RepID=A0A165PN15_EXIGL|nr:kinase-like protein [Exidia glandulosa HHB12029]
MSLPLSTSRARRSLPPIPTHAFSPPDVPKSLPIESSFDHTGAQTSGQDGVNLSTGVTNPEFHDQRAETLSRRPSSNEATGRASVSYPSPTFSRVWPSMPVITQTDSTRLISTPYDQHQQDAWLSAHNPDEDGPDSSVGWLPAYNPDEDGPDSSDGESDSEDNGAIPTVTNAARRRHSVDVQLPTAAEPVVDPSLTPERWGEFALPRPPVHFLPRRPRQRRDSMAIYEIISGRNAAASPGVLDVELWDMFHFHENDSDTAPDWQNGAKPAQIPAQVLPNIATNVVVPNTDGYANDGGTRNTRASPWASSASLATVTTFHTAQEMRHLSLHGSEFRHGRRLSVSTVTTYYSIDDPAIPRIDNEDDFRKQFSDLDVTQRVKITSSKPLGFGGQADVYQGRLTQVLASGVTVLVAVRIIRPSPDIELDRAATVNRLRRVAREVGIWNTLSHPHIHPLTGLCYYGEAVNKLLAMVSPWCSNGNAISYLLGRQSHSDIYALQLRLLRDAFHGLEYLHGLALVHGDLKGANVLVSDEGRGLLADFGISAVRDPSQTASSTGTFRWMAPELFKERPVLTQEADIWAMGCVIVELVSLKIPYYTIREEPAVIIHIYNGGIPSQLNVPDELWEASARCFAIEPKRRPSAAELGLLVHKLMTSVFRKVTIPLRLQT